MGSIIKLDKKESPSVVDKMKDQMIVGAIESILPTIEPFLKPSIEKLKEFIGDDDKILLLRSINKKVFIFVIDGTKGEYVISNVPQKSNPKGQMDLVQDSLIFVQEVDHGILDLLRGEIFSKQ